MMAMSETSLKTDGGHYAPKSIAARFVFLSFFVAPHLLVALSFYKDYPSPG